MTELHYVIRTFPQLSESFVQREVQELVRRGEPLTVWSLLPADPELVSGLPDEVRAVVKALPSGRAGAAGLLRACAKAVRSRPLEAARVVAWCARWAVRERDPRHLATIPFAAWLAQRLPADAHLHAHFANTPTTVALAAAMFGDQTVSWTGHARDLFVVTSPAFVAEKARRATVVAVETEYSVRRVQALVDEVDRPKVVVIRNGLPPRSPRAGAEIAAPPVVLAVARLVPKKGLETLVRAIAVMHDAGADVRCEIIGDGPQREVLRGLADALGVRDVIDFYGAQGRAAVDAALARATVFCLPCRTADDGEEDNLPVALLEAMQAGVPVVTRPVAGIPEAVIDGETGVLVVSEEPVAFARALTALIADRAGAAVMAQAARDRVAELFDLSRNVALLSEHQRGGDAGSSRTTTD